MNLTASCSWVWLVGLVERKRGREETLEEELPPLPRRKPGPHLYPPDNILIFGKGMTKIEWPPLLR